MSNKSAVKNWLRKRVKGYVPKNRDFIGSVFTKVDLQTIRNETLIRGIDLSLLLDYLGSEGKQRKRDIEDLKAITGLKNKELESLNEGRRLVAWGTIKLIAAWADLDHATTLNILVNGVKPQFIWLDYTSFRIDLRELIKVKGLEMDQLFHVFGRSWRSRAYYISSGAGKLTAVELCKLCEITGYSANELIKYGGLY